MPLPPIFPPRASGPVKDAPFDDIEALTHDLFKPPTSESLDRAARLREHLERMAQENPERAPVLNRIRELVDAQVNGDVRPIMSAMGDVIGGALHDPDECRALVESQLDNPTFPVERTDDPHLDRIVAEAMIRFVGLYMSHPDDPGEVFHPIVRFLATKLSELARLDAARYVSSRMVAVLRQSAKRHDAVVDRLESVNARLNAANLTIRDLVERRHTATVDAVDSILHALPDAEREVAREAGEKLADLERRLELAERNHARLQRQLDDLGRA